jgi:hypothetical protein
MNRVPILVALLMAGVLVCSAKPAQAQFYGRGASAFLLNPYMGLYPPQSSAAMGHYIRPGMMQLQRTLAGQRATLQRLEASAGRQEQAARTRDARLSRIAPLAPIRPTGTGSTFMNYSHYYPGMGARGAAPVRTYPGPRRAPSHSLGIY